MLIKKEAVPEKQNSESRKPSWIFTLGFTLVLLAGLILGLTYYPLIKVEIKYHFSNKGKTARVAVDTETTSDDSNVILPANANFSIIIPKIGVNSRIITDVNWQDPTTYQKALTKGVAHARGSAYPDENGNVFIFAHSGNDFLEAARFNAVFYLLNKLAVGDKIYLFYHGKRIDYAVKEAKTVNASEIQYLEGDPEKKTLTLMTCWPPGTTWKRLLVIAEEKTE